MAEQLYLPRAAVQLLLDLQAFWQRQLGAGSATADDGTACPGLQLLTGALVVVQAAKHGRLQAHRVAGVVAGVETCRGGHIHLGVAGCRITSLKLKA